MLYPARVRDERRVVVATRVVHAEGWRIAMRQQVLEAGAVGGVSREVVLWQRHAGRVVGGA
eukprot:446671-Prymnesium_polylepis.1